MCTILWLTLVINKPKAIAKPGWCFMFYNTCSIRDKAEQKVFNILAHCKKQAAAAKIFGMLGCVAQQEGERIFERAPHVSLVCGSASIPSWAIETHSESDRCLAVEAGLRNRWVCHGIMPGADSDFRAMIMSVVNWKFNPPPVVSRQSLAC